MAATTAVAHGLARLRTSAWTERLWPLAAAGVACCTIALCGVDLPVEAAPVLLSASVTFGAVVFGFVGTCLSILTGLPTKGMRRIRGVRKYVLMLRDYLAWGMLSGMFVACVALLGFFIDLTACPPYAAPVWGASVVFCIACLVRLARVMLTIFSSPENVPGD